MVMVLMISSMEVMHIAVYHILIDYDYLRCNQCNLMIKSTFSAKRFRDHPCDLYVTACVIVRKYFYG